MTEQLRKVKQHCAAEISLVTVMKLHDTIPGTFIFGKNKKK
jgi:hypothetical protein